MDGLWLYLHVQSGSLSHCIRVFFPPQRKKALVLVAVLRYVGRGSTITLAAGGEVKVSQPKGSI